MLEWWNVLNLFQQIMVCIAAPATLLIIIQLILILIGFHTDDSFETGDTDNNIGGMTTDVINNEGFFNIGGLKILTIRGVLAFLSVGGWLALALAYTLSPLMSSIIGILAGALISFLIAFAMHSAMKLQSSGNIDYTNAVSHTATVYIRIPPKRTGKGKINITIQERFTEIDAVSDDEDYIDTGLPVNVISLIDDNTVLVSRIY